MEKYLACLYVGKKSCCNLQLLFFLVISNFLMNESDGGQITIAFICLVRLFGGLEVFFFGGGCEYHLHKKNNIIWVIVRARLYCDLCTTNGLSGESVCVDVVES